MRRKPTLLIVGCGDVGLRVLRLWHGREELRRCGATPLIGDLDDARTLDRLAGLADVVLHLAPPPLHGATDPRTAALLQALSRRSRPVRLVYMSTSGVYGDCAGDWVTESRPVNAQTDRARRRVDAESRVRTWARATGVKACILRVPGIYALDREGGDPRDRVRRGTPALIESQDGYTNHIQADDLARITMTAAFRGAALRAYHASDDGELRTGDHYDLIADLCRLPRPRRIDWDEARRTLSSMQLSFWGESRRLDNTRLKKELRVKLRHPTVADALTSAD